MTYLRHRLEASLYSGARASFVELLSPGPRRFPLANTTDPGGSDMHAGTKTASCLVDCPPSAFPQRSVGNRPLLMSLLLPYRSDAGGFPLPLQSVWYGSYERNGLTS